MFLLLPVVVLAALVAVVAGVPGRTVVRGAGLGVAAVVVLGLVAVVALTGLGGSTSDDGVDDRGGEAATTSNEGRWWPPVSVRPVDATMGASEDTSFPVPERPLDGLVDGDVVLLEAHLGDDGELRQCPSGVSRRAECGAGVPVLAPREGTARFLSPVEVVLDTPLGPVDCGEQACELVLFASGEDEILARRPLLFGVTAPDPRVSVRRRGPYADGEVAAVALSGFVPGEEIVITQCTAPGPTNASRCGAPAPEVTTTIDRNGTAVVEFPVRIGAVGAARRECRRGEPCAIAVLGSTVSAPVAELSLAGSPSADVADRRVALGLVAAILGVLAAVVLVRRTDWSPPEGDPFAGMRLSVPAGWEDLRAQSETADLPAGW